MYYELIDFGGTFVARAQRDSMGRLTGRVEVVCGGAFRIAEKQLFNALLRNEWAEVQDMTITAEYTGWGRNDGPGLYISGLKVEFVPRVPVDKVDYRALAHYISNVQWR